MLTKREARGEREGGERESERERANTELMKKTEIEQESLPSSSFCIQPLISDARFSVLSSE